MAEKYNKPEQFVTPAGIFVWPRLGEPDYKYKKEGEYSLKLRMPLKTAQPLLDKLEPMHQSAIADGHVKFSALPVATRKKLGEATDNPLFALDYDEQENETGDVVLRFGMTASGVSKKTGKPWTRKPGVFDAKRKPISGMSVWGGTTGKVAFTVGPYFVNGSGACGLSLRLEAVQILDLVIGGERTAAGHGFSEEDGYIEDTEASDSDADDTDTETAAADNGNGDF